MSTFVPITPDQVTIAVTVYSRRQYIKRAIASALNQTQPVARVMVVEDCGPDPTLQDFVKAEFGDRIEYIRNPKRRGLFDNWNACLELCKTDWLSILHDDDYLAPAFIETMIELSQTAPGCALYYGHYTMVDEQGAPLRQTGPPPVKTRAQRIALPDLFVSNPLPVSGTIFSAPAVRSLGGFNRHSQFAGDWEMWAKLVARYGGAASQAQAASLLGHQGMDRGSAVIERNGRKYALDYVQRKRIAAMLKQQGIPVVIDRRQFQRIEVIPLRMLIAHGVRMSPRILKYNLKLLALSRFPDWKYALGKTLITLLGSGGVRIMSKWWNYHKDGIARRFWGA